MQDENTISAIEFGRLLAGVESLKVTVKNLEQLLTTKHDDHELRLRELEGKVNNYKGALIGVGLASSTLTGLAITVIQFWLKANG